MTVTNIDGGTHLSGFKTALTRTMNYYARTNNLLKEGEAATGDDFIITYFVSGSTVTYPLYVNAAVKAAVPPQINVLATAILVISLILLGVGTLYRRKRIEV